LHLWTVIVLLAIHLPVDAADLSKLDRKIGKEPAYESRTKPKYCLVVVGPEAKTRVWLVLDGDVLYVDRNGDGDLTGEDERILKGSVYAVDIPTGPGEWCSLEVKSKYGQDKEALGHTISYFPPKGKGFAQKTVGVLEFADQPQDAPIVHFGGPLTLTIFDWHKPLEPRQIVQGERAKEVSIDVGRPDFGHPSELVQEFSILAGTPAFGGKHEVFAMIDGYFPNLAGRGNMPTVAVEFPSKNPVEKAIVAKVTLRYCECARRFWFQVRIPPESGKGKAKVTLSFPAWKDAKIAPATFEVPIVDSPR
jgi:hypothetical protein